MSETSTETELKRVIAGRERAAKSRLVMVGLARDLGQKCLNATAHLENLGKHFQDVQVVLFENDSADGTGLVLEMWCNAQRQPKNGRKEGWQTHYVSRKIGHRKWPQARDMERAAAMASYREECRRLVLQHTEDKAWRNCLVVVVDTDLKYWPAEGVLHTLSYSNWDMVASNGIAQVRGKPVQFDAWAYRARGQEAPHHYSEVNPLVFKGDKLVPVNSAFGGLAIYRREAFAAGAYLGGDCEHATFHRSLREAGFNKLFINPHQQVWYN